MASPELNKPAQNEAALSPLIQRLKQGIGRLGLALSLSLTTGAVGGTMVETYDAADHPAGADVYGYPWAEAPHIPKPPALDNITWGYADKATCDNKSAEFDCSAFILGSQWYIRDQWGYDLRNCTSYVAWRVAKEFGVNVSGWGDAKTWDENADNAGFSVDNTPEPGDIAVWDSGTWGHVAFVESVNSSQVPTYSQFNQGLDGNPSVGSGKADHYIDINGTGVGFNGSSVPTSNPNTAPTPTVRSYSSIGEGGIVTDNNWVYKKVGGVVWPIKPRSEWSEGDNNYWSGGAAPALVSTTDIHAYEVGYGDPRAHPAGNNTIVYYDGQPNASWYMFYGGKAYYVNANEANELTALGYKVQSVPQTQYRLDPFTQGERNVPITNRMRYRFAGSALVRLMAQQGGGGFHAFDIPSDTLLNCLEFQEGGGVILLPESARPYTERVGQDVAVMNKPAACEFPHNFVLNGPGGSEKWRISGNGESVPYQRRYYPNALTIYANAGSIPDYRQLRSVAALNNVPQGPNMTIPEHTFFFNQDNGEVYRWNAGLLRKLYSTEVRTCLGNPPVVNIPHSAVAGWQQGEMLGCAFQNKILYGPDGRQFYVSMEGRRFVIGNTAVSACIQSRRGTGSPLPVSSASLNSYVLDPNSAHCPYGVGANFIRESGSPTVWLVRQDGTKSHAGSLCVSNAYEDAAPDKYQVWVVPGGETAGHRQVGDWWASSASCAALPG